MEQIIDKFLGMGTKVYMAAQPLAESFHAYVSHLSLNELLAGCGIVLALFIYSIGFGFHQRKLLARSQEDVMLLTNEIARINQELNVERLWRLAGTQSPELPEETLTKLYRVVTQDRMSG